MQMWTWAVVAAMSLGTVGCGDPAQETRSYFYKGSNVTHSASGEVTGNGETLLRRVFDGPRSQIIEHEVIHQQGRVQENVLAFTVTGSTFESVDTDLTGELLGDPWEWTEWTARGTSV